MAGKKKVADEALNKTARKNQQKGKKEGFIAEALADRFISLNGGKGAYILDPRDGKTYKAEIGSEKWSRIVGELLASDHAPRIQAELDRRGWAA